jgi:hypothetical protein
VKFLLSEFTELRHLPVEFLKFWYFLQDIFHMYILRYMKKIENSGEEIALATLR